MRPAHIALAIALSLAAVLPAAAEAQTRSECEYRNPDHPNWNYLRACTVETVRAGDRMTTTANVDNGSTLTIVEEDRGGALGFVVNGHAATRLEDGASRCFLTIEDEETICIHGGDTGAVAPETATETATGTVAAAAAAPASTADSADATATPLGGGERGQCLIWVADGDREGLIDQGPCIRRTDCAEIAGQDGMSCLIDLIWESGTQTVITRRDGVYTLDGAVADPDEQGCLTDAGAGLHFCFSDTAMTEADYPALVLPPAPEPVAIAAAAAAVDAPALDSPAADPTPAGHRCSFLRDEVEVSSWACTETVACDDPICTVTYAFENGTTVTLDTADGRVMLMNGAKADPSDWSQGRMVDVTRPGAPYTFRFTPGTVAAAAE